MDWNEKDSSIHDLQVEVDAGVYKILGSCRKPELRRAANLLLTRAKQNEIIGKALLAASEVEEAEPKSPYAEKPKADVEDDVMSSAPIECPPSIFDIEGRDRRIHSWLPGDHVTLSQMAGIVGEHKSTLRRLCDTGILPPPDVRGGIGKADQWLWATVGPILEEQFGK